MHIYQLNVVHHLYMLHDDMYNEVDYLLVDIYLQINKLNLDMFVDDDDFFVLKKKKLFNEILKKLKFYEYEQFTHPRSVNAKLESIHLSH